MNLKESSPVLAKTSEMKTTCSTFDIIISTMLMIILTKTTNLANNKMLPLKI